MVNRWMFLLSAGLWACCFTQAHASTCTQDDLNQSVCVKQAQRVLSLAPHLTEIVDFVGGLDRVIAVDGSSNFPTAAQKIPKMSNPWMLGAETILARKPDLVLVWQSGISADVVAQLRKAGVPVFVSEPKSIAQVASTMRRLSKLFGTSAATDPKVDEWLKSFDELRGVYASQTTVPVFYQVWNQPLMTLGGQHVVSEVISLCGGRNVFSDLPGLSAEVSVEGVLKRQPALLLTSGSERDHSRFVKQWSSWSKLEAVRQGRLKSIPNDILVRNGPRLLNAARLVCEHVRQVRVAPRL